MVRGQAGSDAEHWPWTRIRLKNPSAWWIDANHAKPFGQRGLSAVPRPSPAAQMLYMKTSEVGGWFTHRARSSLDDDRCNSWTAVTETLHREGAPSPCCPSSDAGLSCWNTATKRGGGGLIIIYTYEQIPSEDPHTHRHVAPTHKQSEQKQTTSCLFSFSSLSFSQTLVDRWKGDDGPVYSGISWSRRCHNNVKHHILSIHTDSNQTTLSHKSLIQYHKWYQ